MDKDFKLKSILLEMPMLGQLVSLPLMKNIEKSINTKLNSSDLVYSQYDPHEMGEDFTFIQSTISGDMGLRLICLIKKIDGVYELCFASILKPFPKKIEDMGAYSVTFSNKYRDYKKHQAATAYLKFLELEKDIILTSDESVSDSGAGIWMELLTRPDLKEDVFVWNKKTESRENMIDFKQIFGHTEKYKDYIICLKPKI